MPRSPATAATTSPHRRQRGAVAHLQAPGRGKRAPIQPERGKRAHILAAATDVFLEAGYAAASMDRIAQAAGVSKVTIYNHYAGKDALFTEIVIGLRDRMLAPLGDAEADAGGIEATLRRTAGLLMGQLRDPRAMALYRLVIAETPKFPALGAAFLAAGPERAVATLAAWLERQAGEGRLLVPDPRLAAELFFGMVAGAFQARSLLAQAHTVPESADARYIDRAVTLFLQGHAQAG